MGTKNIVKDHKHPMKLRTKAGLRIYLPWLGCHGCGTPVSDFPAFSCNECNILIHKECERLALEVRHSMHSEHPLHLAYNSKLTSRDCKACAREMSDCFTYWCETCKFYLCVVCGLSVSKSRMLQHESHPHPLMLVPKQAEFYCDACDRDMIGWSSYVCKTCSFWIDDNCANLPTTVAQTNCHEHPLSLAYGVPSEFRDYNLPCDLCDIALDPLPWVYFCRPCRFFIHIKCYRKRRRQTSSRVRVTKKEHGGLAQLPRNDMSVELPWNDMSVDIIRPFIAKNSQTEIQALKEIEHFSHEHQLILSNTLPKMEEDSRARHGEEKLCDGCVQPISVPYYYCPQPQCDYLLHLSCANLPSALQHQSHPEHHLSLRSLRQEFGYFYCRYCKAKSNGFFYECKGCEFRLDLCCAVLPMKITHKTHQHPLVQKVVLPGNPLTNSCIACGKRISGLIYRCEGDCYNMYIHYACATMLPPTVKHRWDKHQLILSYPPFDDRHSMETYCEICEEEIHPKYWKYDCRKCDQSFHLFCIPRIGKDGRIKFGRTLRVEEHHQHPLKSVREGKYKSKCARCGIDLYGHGAFECEVCPISWCFQCVCSLPPEPRENDILPGQQKEDKSGFGPADGECTTL